MKAARTITGRAQWARLDGKVLQQRRMALAVSQAACAEIMNVTTSCWANWEGARGCPLHRADAAIDAIERAAARRYGEGNAARMLMDHLQLELFCPSGGGSPGGILERAGRGMSSPRSSEKKHPALKPLLPQAGRSPARSLFNSNYHFKDAQ